MFVIYSNTALQETAKFGGVFIFSAACLQNSNSPFSTCRNLSPFVPIMVEQDQRITIDKSYRIPNG